MPRAYSLLVALPLLLLSLAGCNPPPTQGIGGVQPKAPVTAVVSLSPSTTEFMTNLAVKRDMLRGRTAADVFPPDIAKVPVVASVKPDYEKIAQIKPDLVLLDPTLYSEADVAKLEQLGLRLEKVNPKNLTEYVDTVRRLGKLLGAETNFNEYADKVENEIQAAIAVPLNPKPRVAIVMPGEGGEHMIAGTDSFLANVVREIGGDPVGPAGELFVTMNPESFIQLNPDVIITSGSPDPIAQDPRLKPVKAVSSGRTYGIKSDVLLRRGARVDTLVKSLRESITRK
jgi:iron complex transport system substrate-binding protein